MEGRKHIVMFSGGASSAYVAYLVSQEQRKEDIILLHTPTYAEHKDADRFRNQVSKFLGIPITVEEDGRSLWQIIDEYNALPSHFMPFCTQQLKIAQSRKFWNHIEGDFIVYFGYGADEWRRVQKQTARLESEGVKTAYPVFERRISNDEVKRIIRQEWKICLPEPYIHLEHNNCIPCFKGGKGHFRKVAKYYPEEFKKAMEKEEKIGHTVFKDCTLKDVWEEVQQGKMQEDLFEDDTWGIPCMCAD